MEPFYEPFGKSSSKSDEGSSTSASSAKPVTGEKFTFVEEWGEQLVGKSHPVICVLRVSSGEITVLRDDGEEAVVPPTVSPAQAVWVPGGAGWPPAIVFVGFDHSVERLGIIYCPIRPSTLYYVDLTRVLSAPPSTTTKTQPQDLSEGEASAKIRRVEEPPSSSSVAPAAMKATPFGPRDVSVRSPRFSPDGRILVFLENPAGGPHHRCARLMSISFNAELGAPEDESLKTLVDVVESFEGLTTRTTPSSDDGLLPPNAAADKFYGIYAVSLPRYCWDDAGRVWINTIADSFSRILVVDGKTGESTTRATFGGTALGVFGSHAVSYSSSAGRPGLRLDVRVMTTSGGLRGQYKTPLSSEFLLENEFSGERFETIHYGSLTPARGPPIPYSALLRLPFPASSPGGKCPLIVFPHGGPHSAFTNDWSLYIDGFLRLGFAVLAVNYRGSVGRGQASIDSLPGHVGDYDVEDVHRAALHALRENPAALDEGKVAVFGGSHGGFLTAHLIGKYPDFYRVAVCRNPVINLANMFGVTDIPDWTYVEGVPNGADAYAAGVVPSAERYKDLISRSPIAHAHNVKCPTMILVGLKDLRVPPSQGIQFYKCLKARGVETDLKTFPEDVHSLSRVETEAECFVLVVRWFLKHLQLLAEEEEKAEEKP